MTHITSQPSLPNSLVMAQLTVLLFLFILANIASTFNAQVNQCEYVIMIHTGPTKGPTVKLKTLIEAVGGGNINTTNLVQSWGDMGKGHTYFLPNSSDRFKYNGPCFNGRFCYFQLRGKKGELNPHWYVHNITVTTKGEGIDRVRDFFSGGIEIDYLYSPPLNDGECP